MTAITTTLAHLDEGQIRVDLAAASARPRQVADATPTRSAHSVRTSSVPRKTPLTARSWCRAVCHRTYTGAIPPPSTRSAMREAGMTDSTLLSSLRHNDWRSPVSQVLRST